MLDGKKVRLARRRACMTQLALAEEVGCDNNTISRLEKGHIGVSVKLAQKIASALGLPVAELTPTLAPAGALVAETEVEQDILDAARRAGEDGAREIRAYALALVSGLGARAALIAGEIEGRRRTAGDRAPSKG